MGQLIVTEFVTLDGVMEAPGGEPTHRHTGWVAPFFDDEIGAFKQQETLESECLLLGRVTYESFAGAWPTYEGEMAVKMNSMPKHVVTSSTAPLEWTNSHRLNGPVESAVRVLMDATGGIVPGPRRCQLVHAPMRAELVDEVRPMGFPGAVGGGRPPGVPPH